MTSAASTGHPTTLFRKAGLREAAVLLAVAWLVPFAIHLVPWTDPRPLGAFLLPMFWATFVAVYLYGAQIGLLAGLFAPGCNLLVTGLPAWRFLSVMSFELVVFALAMAWAVRRAPRFVLLAPLGYVIAKVASTGLQAATTAFGNIGTPGEFFARSLFTGLAGLVVLAAINAGLVWFYPKTVDRAP